MRNPSRNPNGHGLDLHEVTFLSKDLPFEEVPVPLFKESFWLPGNPISYIHGRHPSMSLHPVSISGHEAIVALADGYYTIYLAINLKLNH